jgi:hypothetical protein
MKKTLRVLSILVGAMFLVQALRWLADPGAAAEALGMELLTGVGASTQIGDIGAFFLSIAIMVGIAQRPGAGHWLYPAALLLFAAAVMRALAWATGSADFAPQFIAPEIVMGSILFLAARLRAEES